MSSGNVAEKLVELRGNRRREDVAKAVGVSVSAISMYENGERIPRDYIKERIAAYYGKTVQEIFFYSIMSHIVTNKPLDKPLSVPLIRKPLLFWYDLGIKTKEG